MLGRIYKIFFLYGQLNRSELIVSLSSLLLIIAHHLIYFYECPFTVDEVFAYSYSVSKSFWHIVSVYEEPNNHVLYNLCCHTVGLFINNPVWIMRLPTFIFSLILYFVIFTFCLKNIGFKEAIFSTLVSAFSYSGSIYCMVGRGYILLSLCCLISCFSIIYFLKWKDSFYLKLFSIFSVAGFFTIPVYAYYFFGMLVFSAFHLISIKDYFNLKKISIICISIIFISFLLYFPIIITSGYKSLFFNKWIIRENSKSFFFQHILPIATSESIDYLFDLTKKGWALCTFLLIIFYFTKNTLKPISIEIIKALFIILITSFIMVVAMRKFPPYRIWTTFEFLLSISVAIIVNGVLKIIFKDKKIKALCFSIIVSIEIFNGMMAYQRAFDSTFLTFSRHNYKLLDKYLLHILNRKPKYIYAEDDYFKYYLQFNRIIKKGDYELDKNIHPFKNYNYIIVWQKNGLPEKLFKLKYKKIFNFQGADVYENTEIGK